MAGQERRFQEKGKSLREEVTGNVMRKVTQASAAFGLSLLLLFVAVGV